MEEPGANAYGGGADAAPDPADGAPNGPGESEEAAFIAEEKARADVMPGATAAGVTEGDFEPEGSLPPLEDLVGRIPPQTRALMDELFRAKFITVRRVPKGALKKNA